MKLTINPEYEKLVPELSKNEYEILKESIDTHGLWVPLTVNNDKIILDGHHRYDICHELGVEVQTITKQFESSLLEEIFVLECNAKRRQLNDLGKHQIYENLKPRYKKLAKPNQGNKGKPRDEPLGTSDPNGQTSKQKEEGRASTKASKSTNLSRKKAEKMDYVKKNKPDLYAQIGKTDKMTVNKAYSQTKNAEKKQKRKEDIQKTQVILPDTITLYHQEFQTAPIKDNSVSLIITDPLYHAEHLHLYTELGEQAAKVLKDGGSLVTYCGHFNIDEVIAEVKKSGLKFQWVFAIIHSGPTTRIHSNKVHVGWKPMLWFTKGKYDGGELSDVVYSKYEGKELHEYEQSTKESDYFIKQMTIENEIVYDPFMGSGTFGVSAKNLKRQFIGCEKDEEHYQDARSKIVNG